MSDSKPTLKIALGQSSRTGLRERNEDFYGCVTPSSLSTLQYKGITAIIADGVGGSVGGLEASQFAVGGFFSDYYSTPDSWDIDHSVAQVLKSINSWLYSQGQKAVGIRGLVTTFSMVIFCGNRAWIFHVGDTRVYHMRKGTLNCLTKDHHSPQETHIVRALGLDSSVRLDVETMVVEEGDLFLMTSDGVHGVLEDDALAQLMISERSLQSIAEVLTSQALEAGSPDNMTAQVLEVESLPLPNRQELYEEVRNLRFPPPLKKGDLLEGYRVLGDVATGGMGSLYLAENTNDGEHVVLKCPSLLYEGDALFLERFLREEWVGRRVHSPHLMQIFTPSIQQRQYLYLVMEHCQGRPIRESLDAKKRFEIEETIEVGKQLCRGLNTLHRLEIIHRDLKPDNILISKEGSVKIVDYGIVHLPALKAITREGSPPGSSDYMAPELFRGDLGSPSTDIFAVGVTLYEMLTGALPFKEIDEKGNYQKKEYHPGQQIRDDFPQWLDAVLEKATHKKAEHRYAAASELLFYLENPGAVPLKPRLVPLIEKNPVLFWKLCSGLLLVLNLLLLSFLLSPPF